MSSKEKRKSKKLDNKKPKDSPAQKKQKHLAKSITEHLKNIKVEELTSMMKGELIRAQHDDSLIKVLSVLIDNRISSVPIEKEEVFMGFVSMRDLVATIVEVATDSGMLKRKKDADDEDEFEFFEENLLIESLDAKCILDFSERTISHKTTISIDQPAYEAALLLKDHSIVAVLDGSKKLVGIVSQSGLVEYIGEELASNLEKIKVRIEDLDLPKVVYSVGPKTKAVDAFKKMKEKDVSGLAVVDDRGKLLDVISVSDLTLWSEWVAAGTVLRFHNLSALASTVEKFLDTSRSQRNIEHKFPLICKRETPLNEVISTMLVNNVHRLFVVDTYEITKLISVVNYGHVISTLLQ